MIVIVFLLGPKLQDKLSRATMVTSPDGKGVFLIAGYKAESKTAGSTIYEYRTKWHGLDEWRDDKFYLIQSLSFGRYYPIAFFLPNEYAKCSKYICLCM